MLTSLAAWFSEHRVVLHARRLRKHLLVLCLLCVPCSFPATARQAQGPTPEQRFFDWTDLQFDSATYQQRRDRLISVLQDEGGGLYLAPSAYGVSHGSSFRQLDDFLYFTGLELPHSILVIDIDAATTTLFVPPRDARFENRGRPNDFPGRPLGDDPALRTRSGIANIRPFDALASATDTWVAEGRALWINPDHGSAIQELASGFVSDWVPSQALLFHLQQQYPSALIKSAYTVVAGLRMIKGAEEIEAMRQVCTLTMQAIRDAARFITEGVDERSLEAALEAAYKRGGAQRLAFSSIIKSGPNSLWPWRILAAHNNRRNRTMHQGELVIFDVGTELNHYVSDVGRTFPVSGHFNPEQRRTLEMATSVSDAIIAAVRPGITFQELTRIALSTIPPSERKYMQTGSFFGHHIGLSTGDPSLRDAPLAPGMIFTVEPWYYNHDRGFAVFVEDVILVTEDGAENLTAALPRTPAELERLVGQ